MAFLKLNKFRRYSTDFMKIQKCQKCPLCKAGMKPSKTSLPYEIGDDSIIVIKDVPAIVCSQCGEFFIEIPVVRIIEQITASAK